VVPIEKVTGAIVHFVAFAAAIGQATLKRKTCEKN